MNICMYADTPIEDGTLVRILKPDWLHVRENKWMNIVKREYTRMTGRDLEIPDDLYWYIE